MKRMQGLLLVGMLVLIVAIVGFGQLGEDAGDEPPILPPSQLTTMEPDYTPTKTNVPGGFPYSLTGQGGEMDALLLMGLVVLFLMVLRRRR